MNPAQTTTHNVASVRLFFLASLLLLSIIAPRQARADITPELRVKILLTALGFDRTLAASDDYEVVIGVYGECPAYEVLQQAGGKKINGKPISIVKASAITYAYLEQGGITVVYVCQITEDNAKILGKAAPRLGVAVLADNAGLVNSIALMGVREQGDRPRLRLNMRVAKESKIELDPQILGNADIITE